MSGPQRFDRLPFEPLLRYVESVTPLNANIEGEGLARFGWDKSSWQMRAFEKGRAVGWLTVMAADRLACALGHHPSAIWGDAWWTHTDLSLEELWAVPRKRRRRPVEGIDDALREANCAYKRAQREGRLVSPEVRAGRNAYEREVRAQQRRVSA